jgi:protein-S-isoprenylcysteine O-methyltransferase Ste14
LPQNLNAMALIHSFEKSGNWLFKHRGQIPVVLFVLAIPVVYYTSYDWLGNQGLLLLNIVSIAISIAGFLVRAISIGTTPKGTSGRNTKQGQVAESLNNNGIYSTLRHPLYLGNYLMWTGIVLFTYNFWFVGLVSLAFWLYYERIMFAEERFLERKFGQVYLNWSMQTPAFVPSFKNYTKNTMPFSLKSVLRREYSGALATVFGFTFIDLMRIIFKTGQFEWQRTSVYALLIALLLTLILRSIKYYTHFFNEAGRS